MEAGARRNILRHVGVERISGLRQNFPDFFLRHNVCVCRCRCRIRFRKISVVSSEMVSNSFKSPELSPVCTEYLKKNTSLLAACLLKILVHHICIYEYSLYFQKRKQDSLINTQKTELHIRLLKHKY